MIAAHLETTFCQPFGLWGKNAFKLQENKNDHPSTWSYLVRWRPGWLTDFFNFKPPANWDFSLWVRGAVRSSWLRSLGVQQRACVRHHHRGTERLTDDWRENRRKWLALIQEDAFLFNFLMMREKYMSPRYSSSLFSPSHVKEHETMRVSLTQSRIGQEGAGRQAGDFPKLNSPSTLTELLQK